MSKTRTTGGILILAMFVFVGSPAPAQNPFRLKPGASGDTCLECHTTFEETLKLSSVHAPVRDGECTGCHNPHAAEHGALLSVGSEAMCTQCHEDLVPETPRSAHAMVLSGDCGACHDPHATDYENNLLSEGNSLCEGCHEGIAEAASSAKFSHGPVEQGCETCHDPHASGESEFLLRSGEPELCVSCHDTNRASFGQQHMNYPVEEARCSSCHDPHGSNTGGILWATVHRPVVNKMCNQCHNQPTAANALALKKEGTELCRGCHSTMLNEMMLKDRLHWPIADSVSCQHCHSPHASKEAGLLPAKPAELCGECHADTIARQERSVTKHAPIEEGECTACHSPHSSDDAFLLASGDSIELCGTCHEWETHSTHPIGEKVLDSRNVNLSLDCSSCHRSHGSEHKYFAPLDPDSELCVDCHENLGR